MFSEDEKLLDESHIGPGHAITLKLLEKRGAARATYYVLKEQLPAT